MAPGARRARRVTARPSDGERLPFTVHAVALRSVSSPPSTNSPTTTATPSSTTSTPSSPAPDSAPSPAPADHPPDPSGWALQVPTRLQRAEDPAAIVATDHSDLPHEHRFLSHEPEDGLARRLLDLDNRRSHLEPTNLSIRVLTCCRRRLWLRDTRGIRWRTDRCERRWRTTRPHRRNRPRLVARLKNTSARPHRRRHDRHAGATTSFDPTPTTTNRHRCESDSRYAQSNVRHGGHRCGNPVASGSCPPEREPPPGPPSSAASDTGACPWP